MKFFVEGANALASWSGFLAPAVWKGFVILAVVFVMMALWRRSTAAGRHLAWAMTFVCLLCLPIFVQCLPTWRAPAWMVPGTLNNSLPNALSFVLQNQPRPEPKPPPPVSENGTDARDSLAATRQPSQVKSAASWGDLAVVVWFAGIMIGLMRLLAVQIRLERMAGRMQVCEHPARLNWVEVLRIEYRIRRPVKLLISEIPISPMTWGFWRPIIALPAEAQEWPGERLRVVVRHELAHVKRWDCLTQEIAHLVCALYWFNPLAWLAADRMRAERERACDDFVLNAGARPSEYAGHLLGIARQFASLNLQGAVAMARPSGLQQRVLAILDRRRQRRLITKTTAMFIVFAIFGLGLLIGGCSNKHSSEMWSLKQSEIAPQLKSFVAEKEAQAEAASKTQGQKMPAEFRSFFAAAAKGNWLAVSNEFENFRKHAPQYKHPGSTDDLHLRGTAWQAAIEIWGTFDCLAVGDEKYAVAYGRDIIDSIPPGSIYFGGTDPGRFLITGMEKSQVNADPFFLLTQNALADSTYLDYVRTMYGGRIYIPTAEDSQKAFQDYTQDVAKRQQNNQLKPGEDVKVDPHTGRVQVSGQVAVMEINGLLVKDIFDRNTNQEFYIEESFPLDWTYPYLEPHGLIFKLNRQPLPELSDEIVQRDHDYWTKTVSPMIGGWLNDGTTIQEIAAFAEKIFAKHDFSGFTGDPRFVENAYSQKMFSKERCSIAGLYAWRAQHATNAAEKQRMNDAADFAFRQAWALCPYSPEPVSRYANFLTGQNRFSDALVVAGTAAKMPEMKGGGGAQIRDLLNTLQRMQQRQRSK
jgi:beta-lactamase regulating signal transducer with metallopeptidase domain